MIDVDACLGLGLHENDHKQFLMQSNRLDTCTLHLKTLLQFFNKIKLVMDLMLLLQSKLYVVEMQNSCKVFSSFFPEVEQSMLSKALANNFSVHFNAFSSSTTSLLVASLTSSGVEVSGA